MTLTYLTYAQQARIMGCNAGLVVRFYVGRVFVGTSERFWTE